MAKTKPCRDRSPGVCAIIFDFDGVILESNDIKASVFSELFREWSEHLPAILDLHWKLGGVCRYRKFDLIYRDILGLPLDEAEQRQLGQRFEALVAASIETCPFVPGALEFLTEYASRIPLFVVSGAPEAELRAIVTRRGIAGYFTEVHGSPRAKTEIIAQILDRHRFDPATVVFVGDSSTDHEAARQAGLAFVGRLRPGRDNLFSPDTEVMADLSELGPRLARFGDQGRRPWTPPGR